MKKISLVLVSIVFLALEINAQNPLTDADGNTYNVIEIGTQVWMSENLKTEKLNDDTGITNIADNTEWAAQITPAFCWYDDSVKYKDIYGALYNWYTVNTNKLCPTDWHVPTLAEWDTLAEYLGGSSVAGSKLKEIGNTTWSSLNTDATNESGFTALPGGARISSGDFNYPAGQYAYFWTSTNSSSSTAVGRYVSYYAGALQLANSGQYAGMSVRCMLDSGIVNDYTPIDNPTSINKSFENKNSFSVNIYPNPAEDILYIDCIEVSNCKLSIYDIAGKIVMKQEINSINNSINISSLSSGVYMLRVTGLEGLVEYKLVKK